MAKRIKGTGRISQSGGGSACVSNWNYDPDTQQLHIDFVKRGSHDYNEVPQSLINAFERSGSAGRFFNYFIRNGGFG